MLPEELGQKVKAKYPQYAHIDDAELGRKIASKYPEYQIEEPAEQPSFARNFANDAGDIVGGAINAVRHPIETAKSMGKLALGEVGQFSRVIGMLPRGIPETESEQIAGQFNKEKLNELRHPIKSFYNKPISTTLDAMMVAEPFTGMVGKTAAKVPSTVAGNLEKSAATKVGKAQELTAKVLKPKNLGEAIDKGKLPPSITETPKHIKKVKNYQQLRDIFEKAKAGPMQKREDIYQLTKGPKDISQIDEALKLFDEQTTNPRVDPLEARKTRKVLERELTALKSESPQNLTDPKYLQTQKEFYQGKANALYKKAETGTITGNETAQLKTYAKLADGYKTKLESLDPRIEGLNREHQGLNQGQELAAEMAGKQMSADTPGRLEQFVNRVPFINRFLPFNEAKNIALDIANRGASLPSRTGKIENLMKVAERDKALARMLRGEKTPPPYEIPPLPPESSAGGVRPRGPRPGSGLISGPQTQPLSQLIGPPNPIPQVGPKRLPQTFFEGKGFSIRPTEFGGSPTPEITISGQKMLPAPENLYGQGWKTLTPEEQAIRRTPQILESLPEGPTPVFPRLQLPGEYSPIRPNVDAPPVRGTFPLDTNVGIEIPGPTPYQKGINTSILNRLLERAKIWPKKWYGE